MAAELVIEPGRQFASEAAFLSTQPPNTIGVEVVSARPRIIHAEQGPYMIIDHHADVERRVTLAACQQAWDAVGLGLVNGFTDADGNYRPRVLVRDCDQDVILAHHIIDRAEIVPRLTDTEVDRIDELVQAEGMLDVFGGVPPRRITPRLRKMMERIAWIFDPYTDYRKSGELYRNNADNHRAVMEASSKRISRYASGHGRSRALDTRYETKGTVGHCMLVERIGAEALLGACSDGAQAVILWQPREGDRHQYTYYRRSTLVGFALDGLYATLNQIEGCPPGQGHGGSDNMGGSPLENGSGIPPDQMLRIIAANPQLLTHTTPGAP